MSNDFKQVNGLISINVALGLFLCYILGMRIYGIPYGQARGTYIYPRRFASQNEAAGVIPATGIACPFSDIPPSSSFFAFIQLRQRRGGFLRRRDKKGLTLLEVLMATVIITIVSLSLLNAIISGYQHSKLLRARDIACLGMRTKLDNLESGPYSQVVSGPFDIKDSSGTPIEGFSGQLTVNEVDPDNLKELTLAVTYNREGEWPFTVTANTAIANK